MDINFEYYKIFYYVAKYGNLTRAAHVLGSGQPNITRAINCLEHEINCTLFTRTNRGVQLTPEGKRLFTHVNAAMLQLRAAENELDSYTQLENGNISVGVSETALNIYLISMLKDFHADYPGIRLKIYSQSTPQAIKAVRSGEIDFAVVSTPTNVASPLKEVRIHPFSEILVGGRAFEELRENTLSPAELHNYPLICLGHETATWTFYRDFLSGFGVIPDPDTEVSTTEQLIPLVISGFGLAFVPDAMAAPALRDGEIFRIGFSEEIPRRYICMVYDRQRPLSAAAQKLKNKILDTRSL